MRVLCPTVLVPPGACGIGTSLSAFGSGFALPPARFRCRSTVKSTSAADLIEEATADDWRRPLGSLNNALPPSPAVVALGKFDAMHLGHRSLVEQAASMGGSPWLISFSGMAEELGWKPRLPLVAPSERAVVLRGWTACCGGMVPRMRCVPFGSVRHLSPQQFVEALAKDMRVTGVVVGNNYRFGFKAAGTAETLQQLGQQLGIRVRVLDLLGDTANAVSSSEVRRALGAGQLDRVRQLLGRPYTIVAELPVTVLPPQGQEPLLAAASKLCSIPDDVVKARPHKVLKPSAAWPISPDSIDHGAGPYSRAFRTRHRGQVVTLWRFRQQTARSMANNSTGAERA